jgi:hypothetical protein
MSEAEGRVSTVERTEPEAGSEISHRPRRGYAKKKKILNIRDDHNQLPQVLHFDIELSDPRPGEKACLVVVGTFRKLADRIIFVRKSLALQGEGSGEGGFG